MSCPRPRRAVNIYEPHLDELNKLYLLTTKQRNEWTSGEGLMFDCYGNDSDDSDSDVGSDDNNCCDY